MFAVLRDGLCKYDVGERGRGIDPCWLHNPERMIHLVWSVEYEEIMTRKYILASTDQTAYTYLLAFVTKIINELNYLAFWFQNEWVYTAHVTFFYSKFNKVGKILDIGKKQLINRRNVCRYAQHV